MDREAQEATDGEMYSFTLTLCTPDTVYRRVSLSLKELTWPIWAVKQHGDGVWYFCMLEARPRQMVCLQVQHFAP